MEEGNKERIRAEEKTKTSLPKKSETPTLKKDIENDQLKDTIKKEKIIKKEEIIPETSEEKIGEKKEEIKSKKTQKSDKKEKAIANAYSLPISLKQTKYICKMIKRKSPENALIILEKIAKGKLAVKMTGLEVPHQKGKGIAGARFPKTAASQLINVIKQLKANSIVNSIEDPIISIAMANLASMPLKRGGRRSKRTHIHFEVCEKSKLSKRNK
jgi:ribosomal protein L22